jgi:hypothetical protein
VYSELAGWPIVSYTLTEVFRDFPQL